MPEPSRPLDYAIASPPRRSPAFLGLLVTHGLVPGVALLLMLAVLLFVVPKAEEASHDFKVELPGITRMLCAISRSCTADHAWVVLLALSITVPLILVLLAGPGELPISRRWVIRITLLFLGLFLAVVAVALIVPLAGLLHAVSGASPKR